MRFLVQVGSGVRCEFDAGSPAELLAGCLDANARCDWNGFFAVTGLRAVHVHVLHGAGLAARSLPVWSGFWPARPSELGEELEECVQGWWDEAMHRCKLIASSKLRRAVPQVER